MIYDSILSIGLILILVGMCMADGEDLRMSITFMAIGGAIVFLIGKIGDYYCE